MSVCLRFQNDKFPINIETCGGRAKVVAIFDRIVSNLHAIICLWGYHGDSPTSVQAWQPCPLWEPSPSHPI